MHILYYRKYVFTVATLSVYNLKTIYTLLNEGHLLRNDF